MFSKLHTTLFYVKNIEASKKFYTDILKFRIVDDQGKYVALKISTSEESLLALNSDEKYRDIVGHQTIILTAENIENTYKGIKDLVNVKLDLAQKPWGKTFIFSDLDGNKIEVLENTYVLA